MKLSTMKIPIILLLQILILLPSSLCFGSALHKPVRPNVAKMTALEAHVDPSGSYLSLRGGAEEPRSPPTLGGVLKAGIRFSYMTTRFAIDLVLRVYRVIFELVTGGFLKPQEELPYGDSLAGPAHLSTEIRSLAIQERSLLFTESFRVWGKKGAFCKIRRFKWFSNKDRFKFWVRGKHVATLKHVADADSFEVLRGNTKEKIGRIEKSEKTENKFFVYPAPNATANATEAVEVEKPMYTLQGDFIARRFTMRNAKNQCVAKIRKQMIAFPRFDHFVARVAPGMDPVLVLACTCAIDQSIDQQKKEKIINFVTGKNRNKEKDASDDEDHDEDDDDNDDEE